MSVKNMDLIVKILLVVFGDIYGLIRRIESSNTTTKILGILIFLTGNACGVFWFIDLITVITKKDITVLA